MQWMLCTAAVWMPALETAWPTDLSGSTSGAVSWQTRWQNHYRNGHAAGAGVQPAAAGRGQWSIVRSVAGIAVRGIAVRSGSSERTNRTGFGDVAVIATDGRSGSAGDDAQQQSSGCAEPIPRATRTAGCTSTGTLGSFCGGVPAGCGVSRGRTVSPGSGVPASGGISAGTAASAVAATSAAGQKAGRSSAVGGGFAPSPAAAGEPWIRFAAGSLCRSSSGDGLPRAG